MTNDDLRRKIAARIPSTAEWDGEYRVADEIMAILPPSCTEAERRVIDAARAYKKAADEAITVQKKNGRRGASSAAVTLVNYYRQIAGEKHTALIEAVDRLDTEAPAGI